MAKPLQTMPGQAYRDIGGAPGIKPVIWIGGSRDAFGGAGVLEIIEDHDEDTYRAVYTVRLAGAHLRASRLSEEIKDWHQNA
jgi:hypothetical protein